MSFPVTHEKEMEVTIEVAMGNAVVAVPSVKHDYPHFLGTNRELNLVAY